MTHGTCPFCAGTMFVPAHGELETWMCLTCWSRTLAAPDAERVIALRNTPDYDAMTAMRRMVTRTPVSDAACALCGHGVHKSTYLDREEHFCGGCGALSVKRGALGPATMGRYQEPPAPSERELIGLLPSEWVFFPGRPAIALDRAAVAEVLSRPPETRGPRVVHTALEVGGGYLKKGGLGSRFKMQVGSMFAVGGTLSMQLAGVIIGSGFHPILTALIAGVTGTVTVALTRNHLYADDATGRIRPTWEMFRTKARVIEMSDVTGLRCVARPGGRRAAVSLLTERGELALGLVHFSRVESILGKLGPLVHAESEFHALPAPR